MFKGPDDSNGYGYFYVRLYCTGLEFQANIVEECVLLSALLHIFAGLKRTWDQKLSSGLMSGQLSLAIIGLMYLTYTTTHSFQFRSTVDPSDGPRHCDARIGEPRDPLLRFSSRRLFV